MSTVARRLFARIAGLSFVLLLVSCATVPETGRSQLVLVSAEQLMVGGAEQMAAVAEQIVRSCAKG